MAEQQNIKQVSASEFERQVFDKEEVKLILRTPREQMFPAYNFQNKAASNMSISDWVETRVRKLVGDTQIEIIKGDGSTPHGRTHIEKVRESYPD